MGKHALRVNQLHEGHRVDSFPSGPRGRKRADLRARPVEEASSAPALPRPSDAARRAESRIAERAATALFRAMEKSTRVPEAFVLDDRDVLGG